jgi:hypothetical protein
VLLADAGLSDVVADALEVSVVGVLCSEDAIQVFQELLVVDHVLSGLDVLHRQEDDILLVEVFDEHLVEDQVLQVLHSHHLRLVVVVVLDLSPHVDAALGGVLGDLLEDAVRQVLDGLLGGEVDSLVDLLWRDSHPGLLLVECSVDLVEHCGALVESPVQTQTHDGLPELALVDHMLAWDGEWLEVVFHQLALHVSGFHQVLNEPGIHIHPKSNWRSRCFIADSPSVVLRVRRREGVVVSALSIVVLVVLSLVVVPVVIAVLHVLDALVGRVSMDAHLSLDPGQVSVEAVVVHICLADLLVHVLLSQEVQVVLRELRILGPILHEVGDELQLTDLAHLPSVYLIQLLEDESIVSIVSLQYLFQYVV